MELAKVTGKGLEKFLTVELGFFCDFEKPVGESVIQIRRLAPTPTRSLSECFVALPDCQLPTVELPTFSVIPQIYPPVQFLPHRVQKTIIKQLHEVDAKIPSPNSDLII